MSMAKKRCTDRVVGAILASWRYDISGITPDMRKDYEQHFVECAYCSARQKFHRSLDGALAVLTSLSALFFLFALAIAMCPPPPKKNNIQKAFVRMVKTNCLV